MTERWNFMEALRAGRPAEPSGDAEPAPSPREDVNGAQNGTQRPTAYGLAALERECAKVGGQTEGERNDTLNAAAFALGQLVHAGHLDAASVRDGLAAAARRCGLGLRETEKTIASGLRASRSKPRALVPDPAAPKLTVIKGEPGPELINLPTSATVIKEVINTDTGEVTEEQADFWAERDYLAHIRTFALARMASPWAVLGVCLLRALSTVPPNVVLPALIGGAGSVNLFAALVGPSGDGKGAAESAAADAFRWPAIYTASVGSGEGIAHQYAHRHKDDLIMDRHSVLFTVPEVDTLTALAGRQGATLLTQLRSAFSGERLGFAYADIMKRIPLERHSYRLTLVCGVQPEKAGPLINDSDGGTPQRFIWLRVTDPAITAEPPELPEPLPFRVPDWSALGVDLADGGRRPIPVPDQVARLVRENRAARARGEGDALDGHALFAREKVAVALAVLDGRAVMTDDDWLLSGVIMAESDRTRARIQATLTTRERKTEEAHRAKLANRAAAADEAVTENAIQRVCRNVRRYLAIEPEWGWSDLRRKIGRDAGHLEEVAERLTASGEIEDIREGRKRTIRRAKNA